MTCSPLEAEYVRTFARSQAAFERALPCFPDGVTHVSREMQPFPVMVERAAGARKWTIEGREVVDYMMGHGALLLGHSHPAVVDAVQRQVARCTHPGGSTELEIEWAEAVQRLLPSVERIRFVASGTEAAMLAVRLARTFTGKPRLLRFQGHFHGWSDGLIPESNAPHGGPELGVPAPAILSLPPGDLNRIEEALRTHQDIAAAILEPTGGHWGEVPLGREFLQGLREITARHGVLLICDEVITGFRVAPGGAQEKFGVCADLTVMAKILAGGLPGGAVGGRADVMDLLAASGAGPKVRHPGTFNGNPVSAAAGVAALQCVADGTAQRRADEVASQVRVGLNRIIREEGLPWRAYGTFSDFHIRTGYDGPQPDDGSFIPYDGAFEPLSAPLPRGLVNATRQAMLLEGVDWFGLRGVTSAAHTEADVQLTLSAFGNALRRLRAAGIV